MTSMVLSSIRDASSSGLEFEIRLGIIAGELQLHALGVGADHGAILRMNGGRDDDLAALAAELGHRPG